MGWLWTLIVGFVLGAIGRLILPGKQPMPWWMMMLAGVVGAISGNWIAENLLTANSIATFVIQIITATLAVWAVHKSGLGSR